MVAASCAASTHPKEPSVLDDKAKHDRGVVYGRLPACEKGQVAGKDGKCLDQPADPRGGAGTTQREQLLAADCSRAAGSVSATVRRRQQVLSVKGHDIHAGLNAIVAECGARENRLDVCERAGRYAPDSPFRDEKVRQRDAITSCRELADLYRKMLGQGHRQAP